jgi:glycerol uptake facilitator-like aquaporin
VSAPRIDLGRAAAAEGVGTALLVAAVVGSGIMGERLSGGNVALALLANSLATGGALLALIFTFGPISGAHFNPVVSLAASMEGTLSWRRFAAYGSAQVAGALAAVAVTHRMFDLPLLQWSGHTRGGIGSFVSEIVATFGLLVVIHGTGRRLSVVPVTVAAYITAAYWFTASTAFANPAVTLARILTDTFTGIRAADAPAFLLAQLIGAIAATVFFRWLLRGGRDHSRASASR